MFRTVVLYLHGNTAHRAGEHRKELYQVHFITDNIRYTLKVIISGTLKSDNIRYTSKVIMSCTLASDSRVYIFSNVNGK